MQISYEMVSNAHVQQVTVSLQLKIVDLLSPSLTLS